METRERAGAQPLPQQLEPQKANLLYEHYVSYLRGLGVPVETGRFGADMQVTLTNDGPVTILLDSRKRF